jgi:hypothetical protein
MRLVSERLAAVRRGEVYVDPAGRWLIRPYRPGDEAKILELFRLVFGVERSLEHWRWKYCDNPAGQCHMRLAETPSGELVGQYAGLPVRMAWGAKTLVFDQVIDVMVHPRFRLGLKRPGLFSDLANLGIGGYAGADCVSGGYGFPIQEALRIGQRVAGYTPLHPVVGLVLDLGREAPSESALSGRGTGSRPGTWLHQVREIDRFGPEFDRFWDGLRIEFPVAIVRDAQYLNWRYVACPDVTYIRLAAFHRLTGAPTGVAVLRLGVRGNPVAALVDWLVPARGTGVSLALLARAVRMADQAGMERLQAWFPPHGVPAGRLREFGFRAEPTMYHFVALSMSPEVFLTWAKDQWYYTMGDSDIY